MTGNNVARPGPRPDLERARDCPACNGWGTLVAPGGHGLLLCPNCQHRTPPADHRGDGFPAHVWPADLQPDSGAHTAGLYELRAGHRPAAAPAQIAEAVWWHISRNDAATALCGTRLDLHGDRAILTGLQALPAERVCPVCRQRYTAEYLA